MIDDTLKREITKTITPALDRVNDIEDAVRAIRWSSSLMFAQIKELEDQLQHLLRLAAGAP